ncbi:MAG TPA: DUF1573 domain-containing protein [Chitinophagaceae bacterium]|nr:DUF1573 domain-containing protein [Chitinophagaceae bacterium]
MKKLLKNTWFQIIVAGSIIGLVLIVLDSQFHFWNKGKTENGEYKGPVEGDKDKMYVTTATYSETSFDFGKIKETDTVVHKITIKNTGKAPLLIYKAIGSCECVRAFCSGEPIAPGVETGITIVFIGKGRKGKQNRSVMIDTNTDPAEMVLRITGEVE